MPHGTPAEGKGWGNALMECQSFQTLLQGSFGILGGAYVEGRVENLNPAPASN